VKKNCFLVTLVLVLVVFIGIRPVLSAPNPQATIAQSIFIQSPREGQALQGLEIIEGKIRGEGFIQGKISFSYADVENPTWFFITDVDPGRDDSSQASFKLDWDTNQITDGNYNLRVVAEYQTGPTIFELIPDLRIRNHSPVETSTPAPIVEEGTPEATATPTPEPIIENTPTPLPDNPVVIKSESLLRSLAGSGILVLAVFLAGGIYWFIKIRD
jgi:hypothetical protein